VEPVDAGRAAAAANLFGVRGELQQQRAGVTAEGGMKVAAMTCPYCGELAPLVTGEQVYPHRPDLAHRKMYQCAGCDARVGCHPGTTRPLGRLANAELRAAKMAAHDAFDRLWKGGGMRRGAAYEWLAAQLSIDRSACHIGEFDVADCRRVVAACALRGETAKLPS
jgi:hypothetical protein